MRRRLCRWLWKHDRREKVRPHKPRGIAELPEAWAAACGRSSRAIGPRPRYSSSRVGSTGQYRTRHFVSRLRRAGPRHLCGGVPRSRFRHQPGKMSRVDRWTIGRAPKARVTTTSRRSVLNAYTYAQDPPGIACAEVEFEPVEVNARPQPAGDWDEPADLWKAKRSPPRDMLDGIVPPFLNAFGRDRARSLGVNQDAITAAAVAVVGSLIPATNRLQMYQNRSSWSVLCVLWTALVGDPGSAKSAAVKAALAFASPGQQELVNSTSPRNWLTTIEQSSPSQRERQRRKRPKSQRARRSCIP